MSDEHLRFPTGRFERPSLPLDRVTRQGLIADIARLPLELRAIVDPLDEADLERPYRPGGWTIRQVVHHLPDSHMNGYTRMKLAVTEDAPMIKPYNEARWAELADVGVVPVSVSLALLDALHQRWVVFLRALTDDQFLRIYRHPDMGDVPLGVGVAIYAWHGKHHTAHVRQALVL